MSVALSIVFTGLCALVADGDRTPAQVLLVDAAAATQGDAHALPAHAPTLVARLSTLANAETSQPTRVISGWGSAVNAGASESVDGHSGPIGLWDLTGSEVRIRVPGGGDEGVELFEPTTQGSWPITPNDTNDPSSWRDLRFIPNMGTLTGDGRIDPTLVGEYSSVTGMPRGVAARVHLSGGRMEAGRPSHAAHRNDIFEFNLPGDAKVRQALTDTLRWTINSGATSLIIEIVPLAGGASRRLLLAAGLPQHELFISNLPTPTLAGDSHHAVAEEDIAALHFDVYYDLLAQRPQHRPVLRSSVRPEWRRATGLGGSGFCPPARFVSKHVGASVP